MATLEVTTCATPFPSLWDYDFAEGYRLWREAFDTGKGGVFSITVADAFETVTGAFKNRK